MKTNKPLFNLYQLCVNQLSFSLRWLLRPSQSFGSVVKTRQSLVPASRECLAGLRALNHSIDSNFRIFIAVGFMLVAAPLSGVAYQLFPQQPINEDWFYLNAHYFLLAIGPHIQMILLLTGVFFLMPISRRMWFVALPLAIPISKLLWLITVTSNIEYQSFVPWSFVLIGFLFALIWLFTFHWLTHRKYHEFDAICARIEGLIKLPNLDDHTKVELLEKQFNDLRIAHKS